MKIKWLKRYMPRSLFGRATLILLSPVMTVLLVVSVVYVQRYFDDVTQQMVATVGREIRLVLTEPEGSPVWDVLDIERRQIAPTDIPTADMRGWFDLSGLIVIREMRKQVEDLDRISLADHRLVQLYFTRGDDAFMLELDRRRVSARGPYRVLINMLVFGIVMTIVSYMFLRKQLKPITRLAGAAEAFGRGRHVPYRPRGAVEVRAAGHAFLDMRARIERQIEQRTLLLSGVSHDLRTPLTRLKLGLAMLDDDQSAAMQRDVADMERLLDEFLAFARGAVEGEPEPVDPVALVRQVIEDCKRTDIQAELVRVEGSGDVPLRAGGIRRAVENLVGNAVRYGTRAELSVMLSDKSLRIRVEDDGPGIPVERRNEALKPFVRLDPARNQDRGSGVGLGLAIALDIARAHGGTLRLGESARLGGLRADIVIAR